MIRVVWVLLWISSMSLSLNVAADESDANLKEFEWGRFNLHYPQQGWQLEVLDTKDSVANLRLRSDRPQPLMLIFTLNDDLPDPGEEYVKNPARASLGFGLPIALNLAEKQEKRISVSFNQVKFNQHWELGARFQIDAIQGTEYQLVDAFHYFPAQGGAGLFGALISDGKKGEVVEESDYYDYLYQAYAIIESIEFNFLKKKN